MYIYQTMDIWLNMSNGFHSAHTHHEAELYYPYTSHVSLLSYIYKSIMPFLILHYHTSHSIIIYLHFLD